MQVAIIGGEKSLIDGNWDRRLTAAGLEVVAHQHNKSRAKAITIPTAVEGSGVRKDAYDRLARHGYRVEWTLTDRPWQIAGKGGVAGPRPCLCTMKALDASVRGVDPELGGARMSEDVKRYAHRVVPGAQHFEGDDLIRYLVHKYLEQVTQRVTEKMESPVVVRCRPGPTCENHHRVPIVDPSTEL